MTTSSAEHPCSRCGIYLPLTELIEVENYDTAERTISPGYLCYPCYEWDRFLFQNPDYHPSDP